MKAIIIGSGVGGLSAAIRLRHAGFDVAVYEANDYPGGKLTSFQLGNYRFDAGPSLFTLPHLVDELIQLTGKNPKDYITYQKLTTTCHYFFEDGTVIHAFADRKKLEQEIEAKLNISSSLLNKYLDQRAFIYETASSIFLENSLHKISTWLNTKVLKALFAIPRLGIFSTMNEENKKALRHPKLVQLFNRYATYNGSNPYQAPGILTSIPHLEMNHGAFLPQHGMHDITKALYKAATDFGVTFHFGKKVTQIKVNHNKAVGIYQNEEFLAADVIVSNMDVHPTFRKLMPTQKAPEQILNQERSSSALIFYWGIKKSFAQLDLHNIFFSSDYAEEFNSIFNDQTLFGDPTVYVNITSKFCPADAPSQCENWFVMINVPANKNHPWEQWIPEARKNIVTKLNRLLNTNLEEYIEVESVLDPRAIEQRTSSYQGSLYGTSSNNRFAAFLRHPNFSNTIKNLYFCGGSVHPGGGIPLAILSGKIASELIAEQFNLKIV